MTDYLFLLVEVAVTVYVFLLGLPMLVNQILLPEDLRRFSQKNYTNKPTGLLVLLTGLLFLIVIIAFGVYSLEGQNISWLEHSTWISTFLFLVMLASTLWYLAKKIMNSKGNRAHIVKRIKNEIIQTYKKANQLDHSSMDDLEYLGIYSKAGGEIKFILDALSDIFQVIKDQPYSKVEGDNVNKIIEILCNSVAGTVEPGSRKNMEDTLSIYKDIMMWLEEFQSDSEIHHLGNISPKLQKCITQIALVALRKDYNTLMPRVLNALTMLARPSEKLFEIGVLAIEREQFQIATNVLSELLDSDSPDKFAIANFYGLLAHFYANGNSAQKFALQQLENNSEKLEVFDFDEVIQYHYSKAHFQTVDKLNELKKEFTLGKKRLELK